MKECSEERGCHGKARLGFAEATDYADKLKGKHGKDYGVYRCPHCDYLHLTTKLHKKDEYRELLYITSNV